MLDAVWRNKICFIQFSSRNRALNFRGVFSVYPVKSFLLSHQKCDTEAQFELLKLYFYLTWLFLYKLLFVDKNINCRPSAKMKKVNVCRCPSLHKGEQFAVSINPCFEWMFHVYTFCEKKRCIKKVFKILVSQLKW